MGETRLPCKECISYAICIGQEEIACDTLEESVNFIQDHEAGWKMINETFPKLKVIRNGIPDRRYCPHRSHYRLALTEAED